MVPNFPPKARALQSGSLRNLQASQPSPFVWEYPHPALLAYDPFPLTSAAEPTASLLTCTTSGPWQLVRQNPSAVRFNHVPNCCFGAWLLTANAEQTKRASLLKKKHVFVLLPLSIPYLWQDHDW
ncbi:hypothetical protein V3481_008317 [Fusarium oxysporum f. sp. vasinfectum]|nr:hypothetical protein HZ326_14970 [Fusarium oxysporum f. sp. albedinis]